MRRPSPRGAPRNMAVALLMIGLGATVTGVQCSRNDTLPALSLTAEPLLTSATPRTVTDERPVRLVPTIEKGPEVLAPRGNTPFQVSPLALVKAPEGRVIAEARINVVYCPHSRRALREGLASGGSPMPS